LSSKLPFRISEALAVLTTENTTMLAATMQNLRRVEITGNFLSAVAVRKPV
jgi:hypothetical protein